MAEAEQQQLMIPVPSDDHDRRDIPVFTVSKNNAILKNIFLLHAPPDMRNPQDGVVLLEDNETEQILTVGRHPNCSIVLSHPSISRFHLQIRSDPNLGKLSVTDLSSVHGTWVSGKRIKPRDCVELNEGDELRLGGSSRVYKLHWVSACQAYDLENPFCPSSDVIMCDDIQKHEQELLFQDEAGVLSSGDVNLNSEAVTSLVSRQEVPLQRPVRNETVLGGILKHKKEYSPCMVRPLSFPLLVGETMKVAEAGEIDAEKQLKNAPVFSEIAPGRETEHTQILECDDFVPLCRNLSEDPRQIKQLYPLPESFIEDSKVKAEDCSPLLQECISAGLLENQESPNAMSEEQSLVAEDHTKMPVDNTKGLSRIKHDENSFIEVEKPINQPIIASQAPKLDITVGEFTTIEREKKLDALLIDTGEVSDVGNDVPMLDLTTATVMDNCGSTDTENETPESTPVDAELTIYPESSGEGVSTQFVSNHECDVKQEVLIQIAEVESQSLQLMVNSAVKLGPEDENVAIESGNCTLVCDFGTQILEPLLDSFLFTENDSKKSCGFMSMNSELESQSPITPFGAKSILDNGNEKGSQKVSNRRSNMSNVSSQRCHPLGALKVLSCSSKVKRRESPANARSQLRNRSAGEKSVFKTQFVHEEHKNEMCTPDEANCRYNTRPLKCMEKMGILDDAEFSSSKSYGSHSRNISSSRSQQATSKVLMSDLESVEHEVEVYTPDKENFTPNTRLLKSIKRMGLFNENTTKSSVSENRHALKVSNSSCHAGQNYCSGSEKENGLLFFGQELIWPDARNQSGNKKTTICVQRKSERIPLQSLSISCRSRLDSSSVNKAATRSQGLDTRAQYQRKISPIKKKIELEAKVKWCMVVDCACLLDSESRKALTLLQGLGGTKLIVPGTVLRELDAMNHQASFFRRTTDVSAALKWLGDCLVNTKWWIHIQSSFEEAWHLLPTPPASPKLFDSTHGKKSWKTFCFFRTVSETSSPKAEDHILESALQQMTSIVDNQQIVILSKDTSLKIKAIAQGLVCETATEFRESLVNPFSERFLWTGSSPRGRTWSCHDDIVLKEHFYSQHSTNPSKGHDSVKGLKLILAYC